MTDELPEHKCIMCWRVSRMPHVRVNMYYWCEDCINWPILADQMSRAELRDELKAWRHEAYTRGVHIRRLAGRADNGEPPMWEKSIAEAYADYDIVNPVVAERRAELATLEAAEAALLAESATKNTTKH
jgi:hypothetical protein